MNPPPSSLRCFRRPGFSMVESILCVVIVGGVLVTSLNTIGSAVVARQGAGDRGVGQLLAQDLMTEILRLPYQDPVQSPLWGPEPGETTGIRSVFDDIDDFHDRSESPPQYAEGTQMNGLAGWSRTVKVERKFYNQLLTVGDGGVETGIKRITVEVLHLGKPVARLVALCTDGASAAKKTKFTLILAPPEPVLE